MTFEKIKVGYVLIARTSTRDKSGKTTNTEASKLATNHVYMEWEKARKARQRFVETLLLTCDTAEPIRAIGRDGFPTDEYKGFIIHYDDGGRYESEIEIQRVSFDE